MTNWKHKLLAFLHDPPEKAYDYGPAHRERARVYASNFDLDMAAWLDHHADWSAAAADRFIFPDGSKPGVGSLGGGIGYVHPLTGGKPSFTGQDFPDYDSAKDLLGDILPNFSGLDPQLAHWLLWRLWMQRAAEQGGKASLLPYLPADTRIADATIWQHNAVVGALEGARTEGQPPALLIFQIGPVQEFIAQARSTRDLWSGSFLLSWMMAHVLQRLTKKFGPDCIIYPSLRGQPLFDWLNQEKLKQAKFNQGEKSSPSFWDHYQLGRCQDLALTPNLPNRLLAIVPSNFNPVELEAVFQYDADHPGEEDRSEWRHISDACWEFLNSRCQLCPPDKENVKLRSWRDQCRQFWQIAWQVWPWKDVEQTLLTLEHVPGATKCQVSLAKEVAQAIPAGHRDTRCYRGGQLDPGWAWSALYQLAAHRLDARRQTRDFKAWQGIRGAHKDHLSGKEEAIADAAWLAQARGKDTLRHLFRKGDELAAVNLIKRVWHIAYLENKHHLPRARASFDSVPAVAASAYLERVRQQTGSAGPLRDRFTANDGFPVLASAAREHFSGLAIAHWNECTEDDWFERTDAAVFDLSEWDRAIGDCEDNAGKAALNKARQALARLHGELGADPPRYYAVLALDGDHMGRWINGEMTPAVKDVLTEGAAAYFGRELESWKSSKGQSIKDWLAAPRPLSPSYHLQFSEALANFGLYCARRIVEAHHGQLIYAGGDDVLAMLPADEAIACARGLRLAFQGKSNELVAHAQRRYAHLFKAGVPCGFIQLGDGERERGCRRPAEPSWPLLVPGPKATVSIGIAIGHVREPLQDMVREAQAAEKRAKGPPQKQHWNEERNQLEVKPAPGWGRDALAVTLFKRSGETIQWGDKFSSPTFDLLEFFQRHYRRRLEQSDQLRSVSGKFPYRVDEMLRKFGSNTPLTEELVRIADAEFAWVVEQQTHLAAEIDAQEKLAELRDALRRKARCYLDHLHEFHWTEHEPGRPRTEKRQPRPLAEFCHLFALEAFIARTGE